MCYKILTIPGGLNSCFELGLAQPLELLIQEGYIAEHVVKVSGTAKFKDIRAADLVIFQRCSEHHDLKAFYCAKMLGKNVVYDIDDDLLTVPKHLDLLSDYYNAPHRLNNIIFFYKNSDLIKAWTPTLADSIRRHTKKTILTVADPPNAKELYAPPCHSDDGKIRFIYAASQYNYTFFFHLLAETIQRISTEYGERVQFTFFGARPEESPIKGNNIRYVESLPMDEFIKVYTATTADVSLAPLPINEFTICKSNNKFREYSARGLAGIYTDMPVYADSVEEGITGLLVPNEAEKWYQAMKQMIENPVTTRKMGLMARSFAEQHYTMERYAHWLRDHVLQRMLEKPEKTGQSRITPTVSFFLLCIWCWILVTGETILMSLKDWRHWLYVIYMHIPLLRSPPVRQKVKAIFAALGLKRFIFGDDEKKT